MKPANCEKLIVELHSKGMAPALAGNSSKRILHAVVAQILMHTMINPRNLYFLLDPANCICCCLLLAFVNPLVWVLSQNIAAVSRVLVLGCIVAYADICWFTFRQNHLLLPPWLTTQFYAWELIHINLFFYFVGHTLIICSIYQWIIHTGEEFHLFVKGVLCYIFSCHHNVCWT